jgi:hypothetical protein
MAIRGAGSFAASLALVVLACGSETIDLLPDRSAGGAAMATAGQSNAGTESAGLAGALTSDSGGGGSGSGSGGVSAGTGSGGSCGGTCGGDNVGGAVSSGGYFNGCPYGTACQRCADDGGCPDRLHCSQQFGVCVECDELTACRQGFRCNVSTGRCAPSCDRSDDCTDGRVCDQELGACVQCWSHQQCENDPWPSTHRCVLGQCVECTQASDCQDPERPICSQNELRCVQCWFDQQCPFNQRCELGRCQ